MAGWLAGQKVTAQRLNDGAPFTVNYTAITANTATPSTTAELVAITTPSVTLRNGRAYRIVFKGLWQSSSTTDQAQVRVRKAAITGQTYVDSFRLVSTGLATSNAPFYLGNICTNTSGADITTTLVGCYSRVSGGTGNLTISASATNPAYVEVTDIGPASDYPGATVIS